MYEDALGIRERREFLFEIYSIRSHNNSNISAIISLVVCGLIVCGASLLLPIRCPNGLWDFPISDVWLFVETITLFAEFMVFIVLPFQ